MEISERRERGQPVFVGSEDVRGTHVDFWLENCRRLAFRTSSPVLAFGLRVNAAGTVKLGWGLETGEVEAELSPPDPSGSVPSAFDAGDRDTALKEAVSRGIGAAAKRLVERDPETVARAWLELADDHALARMSYRQHCADKLAELGEAVSWKDEDFYKRQIDMAEREAASIDEETYASAWLHASRPGYVVVCEGKLADRGEQRFKNDRGTGWVQRHVCIHLAEAFRFAGEMGRDSEDVRVERIRIVDGKPYVVTPEGMNDPEWSLEEPVLTGTLMTGPQ